MAIAFRIYDACRFLIVTGNSAIKQFTCLQTDTLVSVQNVPELTVHTLWETSIFYLLWTLCGPCTLHKACNSSWKAPIMGFLKMIIAKFSLRCGSCYPVKHYSSTHTCRHSLYISVIVPLFTWAVPVSKTDSLLKMQYFCHAICSSFSHLSIPTDVLHIFIILRLVFQIFLCNSPTHRLSCLYHVVCVKLNLFKCFSDSVQHFTELDRILEFVRLQT